MDGGRTAVARPRRGGSALAAVAALMLLLGGCRAVADATGGTPPTGGATVTGTAGPVPRCFGGRLRLSYGADAPAVALLCVRPATDLTLVLLPRPGQRWVALRSSNARHARPYGWTAGRNGTAQVSVRCGHHGHARLIAVAMWRSGRESAALTLELLIVPRPRPRRAHIPFLADR